MSGIKKGYINLLYAGNLFISLTALFLVLLFIFPSPYIPEIQTPPVKMPDVEGGPYWTIYVDNLSTTDDEMFIIWEGYEGDLMNAEDADFLIPVVNHTYRFTYVGSNSSFYLDISANEAYNGT